MRAWWMLLVMASATLAAPADWRTTAQALNDAAAKGETATLTRLLADGADVDAMVHGRKALQQAIQHFELPAAKLLHEHGAALGPVAAGDDGALILLVKAVAGSRWPAKLDVPGAVDWLLAAGAKVDEPGRRGATALHHAARRYDRPLCELLLARGAALNARDENGLTPLDYCASRRLDPALRELILGRFTDDDTRDEHDRTLPGGKPELAFATWFRARGADGGYRAAAGLHDMAMLRAWYARTGPGVFAVRPRRWPSRNDYTLAPQFDGSPEVRDPLCAALDAGWTEGARWLLQLGAPLAGEDDQGVPPMALALGSEDPALVRLVLSFGGNPLPMVADRNPPEIARLLRAWKPPPTLFEPAAAGDLAEVTRRLAAGANVWLRDRYRLSALHHAAEGGHLDVATLLLDRGALLDAQDADWRTPLFAAAEAGHLPVVKLLLARGANVGLKDYHGDTALDVARRGAFADIAALLGAETSHGQ